MKVRILQVTSVHTEQIMKDEKGAEKFNSFPQQQDINAVTDEPGELAIAVRLIGPFKFRPGQRVEILPMASPVVKKEEKVAPGAAE